MSAEPQIIPARGGRRLLALLLLLAMALPFPGQALAASRIKDLANVEGVRENMLVGYGLVVGLNGTGDSLRNSPFTLQSLQGMLERLGVNTRNATLNTKNVAAVMVTANLPAFAAQGNRMDVSISALGDATSLRGGTLLVTPLLGADGQVYAVSQGQIAVGGFSAQGASASVSQGVTTAGRIANGALVEREINFKLAQMDHIKLSLRNPDFTTANRVSSAINAFLGENAASASDPATIELAKPKNYKGDLVALLTDIEQLRVDPDQVAKVVVDEASGIIVMGADVRVSTVAIAQGNLTIRITETPQVSQPEPFSTGGTTQVVPRTNIQVDSQDNRKLAVLNEGVSLQALVDGLNALGIGPRDMISILQTIKAAGALQADIEVM
jgi:flagellar P-ring protein precursor FlgI